MKSSPEAERFWTKVQGTDWSECWVWTARLAENGYGRFHVDGQPRPAHCWAYEHLVAPIPDGLELDHLCSNRACVNPWHLDPVTHLVNTRRAKDGNAQKTACLRGHPFTVENTYVDGSRRICRACRRERDRIRDAARPARTRRRVTRV